jgi:hypothetical protein
LRCGWINSKDEASVASQLSCRIPWALADRIGLRAGLSSGMCIFIVSLIALEAEQLQALAAKGNHAASQILNALILLNCDEPQVSGCRRDSEEIFKVLNVGARKIDCVKRRLIEETLKGVLSGAPSTCFFNHKVAGNVEAHLAGTQVRHASFLLRLLIE